MDAIERRERFLLAALEAGGDPVGALEHARAMEGFIVNGLEAQRLLAPPRKPAPAEAEDDGPAKPTPPKPATKIEPPPAKGGNAARPAGPRKAERGKAWPLEKMAEFKRMWEANADISEITAKFNVCEGTAYQRARKLGLGRRRPPGGERTATPAPTPEPDRPDAPPAAATPAPPRPSPTPLPDTSGLPAASRLPRPEYTSIEGVIRFLQSRDIHLEKANSGKTPRWMVEGRRDQALNADELISYANQERRRMEMPLLVYGL